MADISLGFPPEDIAIAKITVRHLVATGQRQCISDLMMLPDHAINEWYDQEAIRFLEEQAARRRAS